MTTLYKLTDQKGYTRNGTKWEVGCTHSVEPRYDPQLCCGDVLHAYRHLNLGLLLNPQHADISNPRIWECEGEIVVEDWGKVGCFELTVNEELEYPDWYKNSELKSKVQIQFAILCAQEVLSVFEDEYPDDMRPRLAIEAAQKYLNNPSSAAARAAYVAARAAYVAANAAYVAADAAYVAADAANAAAYVAAEAADAAANAAYVAANAAYVAANAEEIDFGMLADLAVEMVTK